MWPGKVLRCFAESSREPVNGERGMGTYHGPTAGYVHCGAV
jgi:hypothetical protein